MKAHSRSVRALGEIALRVSDLERMERFYEEVVGLEPMKRFPKAAFFRIAEGHAGHTQVFALFDRSDESRGPQIHELTPEGVSSKRSTLDHLAFEIDLAALESERTRLEGLGLETETTAHEWIGWRSLYFKDPEGNTVEFVCFDEGLKK